MSQPTPDTTPRNPLRGTPTGERPGPAESAWLRRGLGQAGGKLPLFDEEGQKVPAETVETCLRNGWAEPWFSNPLKPDWLVCRLTPRGRAVLDPE